MLSHRFENQSSALRLVLVVPLILSEDLKSPDLKRPIVSLGQPSRLLPSPKQLSQVRQVRGSHRQSLGSHHELSESHVVGPSQEGLSLPVEHSVSHKGGHFVPFSRNVLARLVPVMEAPLLPSLGHLPHDAKELFQVRDGSVVLFASDELRITPGPKVFKQEHMLHLEVRDAFHLLDLSHRPHASVEPDVEVLFEPSLLVEKTELPKGQNCANFVVICVNLLL